MEYMVIIYYKNIDLEEYEYFDNFKKAIKYAKDIKDNNNIIAIKYNDEIIYEIQGE